jgi:hypothetical protein
MALDIGGCDTQVGRFMWWDARKWNYLVWIDVLCRFGEIKQDHQTHMSVCCCKTKR